jgi:hypothetical protein
MHIAATVNAFIVRADEKLTAFVELEAAIRANFPSRKQDNQFAYQR